MQINDLVYVERVLQGEVNAFAPLVNRHKDLVYSICFRVLQQTEEAEEAAQDSFMNAYRSLEKFRGGSAFSTWLYRIAYNTAISRTRRKKFEWTVSDERIFENLEEEEEYIPDAVRKEAQEILLKNAVKHLSEPEQLLIDLFYLKSQSIEDISEITGLGISNVKVKLHRIRKQLMMMLKDDIFVVGDERG